MISLGGTISASFFLGVGSILNSVGAFGTVLGFSGWYNNDAGNDKPCRNVYSNANKWLFSSLCYKIYITILRFLTGWLYLLNWLTAAAEG